jgi:hypothetical protein
MSCRNLILIVVGIKMRCSFEVFKFGTSRCLPGL